MLDEKIIKDLQSIKVPLTVTKIEMNENTADSVLREIPSVDEYEREIVFLKTFSGIGINTNQDLDDNVIKLIYYNGKETCISITDRNMFRDNNSFKMEYKSEWF